MLDFNTTTKDRLRYPENQKIATRDQKDREKQRLVRATQKTSALDGDPNQANDTAAKKLINNGT